MFVRRTSLAAWRRWFRLSRHSLEVDTWRVHMLNQGLLAGAVLGLITYMVSVWGALEAGKWSTIVINGLALSLIGWLAFNRHLSYNLRAISFSFVLFALGVWLLARVGPISAFYLIGASVLATLLLGLNRGLIVLGLNALTFTIFGILDFAAPSVQILGREMTSLAWVTISINFLFVNLILVVAIGVVLNTLELLMHREHEARQALEHERIELIQANLALERGIHERKILESQLIQSQKMEAIGQLAGGVAHDFNNLLTVINGYSDFLLELTPSSDSRHMMIEEIYVAGERASNLTRQLLAFSRRQLLEPQLLDLNTIVTGMEKMLRRLIGEDIRIATVLQPDLNQIVADPGQIEQVIMNLAVNARDAMPEGGQLTIETINMSLSEAQISLKLDLKSGDYVALIVSDTGIGMSPEVEQHIFEPFFTTKPQGKGTGLGLATVFGIVKQSNGFIDVYSEPGHGTRIKILFPVAEATHTAPPVVEVASQFGTETVLLVEDEVGVSNVACQALQQRGYHVLQALNGHEALRIFAEQQSSIDLVITDVVMPEMSGRELVERLRSDHQQVRVLYLSGYTDDAVVRHGIITASDHFLHKPFTPGGLARKVREVLDVPR